MSTAAKVHKETEFAIVINGELAVVPNQRVSFEEAVAIAFPVPPSPETTFTVVFRKAKSNPHNGNLAEHQTIEVRKEGTSFDVYPTGRS
ncbi:multiubiquitin domain-containing protein [Curtobacterium sp. MCBD17_035]|uniref:multiubiquitin domain-containing protein n=1 Tax=Curtobacterium sp. MCBD17_035 TaxID=2175673 RepID=UPI0015E89F86|nr:multiubiquitin domain-containing protein [Curtobacterium sp. MCBD17_035]WIB67576.1 multiubiquitin domain-containing protein [Curtobacterium sp. MCBD17_035]